MATNFRRSGERNTHTAPSGGVVAGNGYQIGSCFVIAVNSAAVNEKFTAHYGDVWTLPKTTGEAWTEGQLLYWNPATSRVTTTAGALLKIGIASTAAGSTATSGEVRLNSAF